MRTLHGIPNCDTVKKARAWLDQHGVAYVFHDVKKAPLPVATLEAWAAEAGVDVLVNRRGTAWRALAPAAQAAVTDAGTAAALLHAHPSVMKRPVVVDAQGMLVGFDAAAWSARRWT